MVRINIGGFATWEKDEEVIRIQYHEDVYRISNSHLPILNVIIENTLMNNNFITCAEIAKTLNEKGIVDWERDTVKKAVQRIREDEHWKEAIKSSHSGYTIKFTIETNTKRIDDKKSELTSNEMPDQQGGGELAENVTKSNKALIYINNFIKNQSRIRTYYYESTLKNVSDVFCPVSIFNKDDDSDVYMDINHLYENGNSHRYIVSGPIGSGKSLLARRLALDAANSFRELGIIPILFDLNLFTMSEKSLFDLLKEEFDSYIPNDSAVLPQAVINLLSPSEFAAYCQNGKIMILFDGLDGLKSELKEHFISKLDSFMRNYSNNTIIMFSRPTGLFPEFDTFTVLNIKPLSEIQMLQLVDGFLSPSEDLDQLIFREDVKRQHNSKNELDYLYSNPLFLSIICAKSKKTHFYPIAGKALSIDSLFKYATDGDAHNQQLRLLNSRAELTQLRGGMQWLCYNLVLYNRITFDADDLQDYFELDPFRRQFDSERFLDDLCSSYGLIHYVDGKYKFIDRMIVEFFFVDYSLSVHNDLGHVIPVLLQCKVYSADNILDMLYELDKAGLAKHVYCRYLDELNLESNTEDCYKRFLLKFYPKLFYYCGEGDFVVENTSVDRIYVHMVKDFNISVKLDQLVFPEDESRKLRAVYQLSKNEAETLGVQEGLIDEKYCKKEKIESLNLSPVGFIYSIKVSQVISEKSQDNTGIRDILMSKDCPLRKAFEQILISCENIMDGEWDQ